MLNMPSTASWPRCYLALLVIGFWLWTPSAAFAQSPPPPVAVASQSFGFDYVIANLSTFSVVRFEQQIDGGAWVSVAIPPTANDPQTPVGSNTYKTPIPALVTGNHTVAFRACNAQVCGDPGLSLTFTLAVKPPAPAAVPRIIGL